MATINRFTCPAALDLLEYERHVLPKAESAEIAAHLEQCSACAGVLRNLRAAERPAGVSVRLGAGGDAVPEALRRASADAAARLRSLLQQPAPPQVRFGQIWSTRLLPAPSTAGSPDGADTPRLIAVLGEESTSAGSEDPSLPVAPISLELAYLSDRDLRVPAKESPLGYPFMIEVWNEVTALKAQLGRYLGELQQPFKRYLGLLYQAQLGADVALSPLRDYLGPAISSEDDPRFAFQEDESEACEYLRRPLLHLLGDLERKAAEKPAELVLRLARENLPGAFLDEEDPAPELTVGDVAARIQADQAAGQSLPAPDVMANRQLLGNATLLPEPITASTVRRLVEKLGVRASERYRELFRRAALALGIAREQSNIDLAAARRQFQPRRRARTEPPGSGQGE